MRKIFLLIMALFAMQSMVKAGEVTVIGNGNFTAYDRVPVYGYYYYDVVQKSQMIYPASKLEAMVGKTITQITFFGEGDGVQSYGGDSWVNSRPLKSPNHLILSKINIKTVVFYCRISYLYIVKHCKLCWENYRKKDSAICFARC